MLLAVDLTGLINEETFLDYAISSNEKTMLEYYILTGPRFHLIAGCSFSPHIIRRQQNKSKPDVSHFLIQLIENASALIGLFMQDERFDCQLFQKVEGFLSSEPGHQLREWQKYLIFVVSMSSEI
jgi:hypothetical protein